MKTIQGEAEADFCKQETRQTSLVKYRKCVSEAEPYDAYISGTILWYVTVTKKTTHYMSGLAQR
jgi:hypothetical protein